MAVAGLGIAVGVRVLTTAHTDRPESKATPAATPSRPATATATAASAEATPTAPVTVRQLGRPLLDVPPSWEIFGRSSDIQVRVQLAAGRVTTTVVPRVEPGEPVSFLAGPGGTIARPADDIAGYSVPDGQTATPLPATMTTGGPAIPGPDPQHVWVQSGHGAATTMVLVGFDGTPTATRIAVPSDVVLVSGDGAGNLLYFGTSGIFDERPGQVRRVTSGQLLASGPTGWLTVDCDDQHRCAMTVVSRADFSRRPLATPADQFEAITGVIAPDGRTAALLADGPGGFTSLHLVDLDTGQDRETGISVDQPRSLSASAVAWSPDSRLIFLVDSTGSVQVVTAATAQAARLDAELPDVDQIAFRSGGASN